MLLSAKAETEVMQNYILRGEPSMMPLFINRKLSNMHVEVLWISFNVLEHGMYRIKLLHAVFLPLPSVISLLVLIFNSANPLRNFLKILKGEAGSWATLLFMEHFVLFAPPSVFHPGIFLCILGARLVLSNFDFSNII